MTTTRNAASLLEILHSTVVAMVRREGPDLTARQLGVLLTCYLRDDAQTVRGLAALLNVAKPAITRALDRLGELDLVRRKTDQSDRRSVLIQRTAKGAAFMREIGTIMTRVEAGESTDEKGTKTRRAAAG